MHLGCHSDTWCTRGVLLTVGALRVLYSSLVHSGVMLTPGAPTV